MKSLFYIDGVRALINPWEKSVCVGRGEQLPGGRALLSGTEGPPIGGGRGGGIPCAGGVP